MRKNILEKWDEGGIFSTIDEEPYKHKVNLSFNNTAHLRVGVKLHCKFTYLHN